MKKIILTIVLATLCLFFKVGAQFYKPSEKTIRIGETLPESFYQSIHHAVNAKTGEATTLQLKDHRNKLIILDFWATWCGPCIFSLNKLDSTKTAMNNDDFIVIPVTYQSAKEIIPVVNKFKWNMTTLVSDTTLAQIFPHSGIPHQVWIKDGKVVAFPQWKYATAININRCIKGEPLEMIMNIQDKKIEFDKPLQSSFDKENEKILFQSLITGEITGAMKSPLLLKQTTRATTFTMINQSVKDLLFEAYQKDISAELIANSDKGIMWEISDSLKKSLKEPKHLLNVDVVKDETLKIWKKNNLYCYQLFYTVKLDSNEGYRIMKHDISKFLTGKFNLHIEMGTRLQKVGILKLINSKENAESNLRNNGKKWKVETQTDYSMTDVGFRALLGLIPFISRDALPINRTGIAPQFPVDFKLPKSIQNNPAIANKELEKYGLKLIIEEMLLPVLIVKEEKHHLINYSNNSATVDN